MTDTGTESVAPTGTARTYDVGLTNATWSSSVSPAQVTLQSGASATVTVFVNVPTTAMTGDSGSVTVQASLQGLLAVSSAIVTLTTTVPAIPAPVLGSLSPSAVKPGRAAFTLSTFGSNLVPSSVVQWDNGTTTPLATSFVSNGELRATVPESLVATPGVALIRVVTPGPGGGTSGALPVTIRALERFDFDGDGKADLAIFRASTGQWFVFGSSTGLVGPTPFGSPALGDAPAHP